MPSFQLTAIFMLVLALLLMAWVHTDVCTAQAALVHVPQTLRGLGRSMLCRQHKRTASSALQCVLSQCALKFTCIHTLLMALLEVH